MKHITHLHLEQVKFKNAWSYCYVLPISLGVGVANSVQWLKLWAVQLGVWFLAGGRNFCLFQNVCSYTVGTTASLDIGEGPGLEADNSLACRTKGKNTRAVPQLPYLC